MFEDQQNDLFLFDKYHDASKTWFNNSFSTSQSHDEAHVGPIITGLRKMDKLLPFPYSSYYYNFQMALIENEHLLIIGYSFGDYQLNSLMERMVRYHGQNRRIAIITYFPSPHEWSSNPLAMGLPGQEVLRFIVKAFMDAAPFPNYQFQENIESADNRARIYLGGVERTFARYGTDIIDFLTS